MKIYKSFLIAVVSVAICQVVTAQQLLLRDKPDLSPTQEDGSYQRILTSSDDQYWVDISSKSGGKLDAAYPLKVYDGALYTLAVEVSENKGVIARYTKSEGWSVVCEVVINGTIHDFSVDGNDIYFCGYFLSAGYDTMPARNIVKYNAAKGWQPLGEGLWDPRIPNLSNVIDKMEAYKGKVYVRGRFTHTGTQEIRSRATWDGSKWIEDFPHFFGYEYTISNGFLYSNFIKWDGKNEKKIADVSTNPEKVVESGGFAVTANEKIYFAYRLANELTKPDSIRGGWIIQDPLNEWQTLGGSSAIFGYVGAELFDIAADDKGCIYISGRFKRWGSTDLMRRLAYWDGSAWKPMGSGVGSDWPYSIAVYEGEVYVGGVFGYAGGKESNGFAKWTKTVTSVVEGGDPLASAAFPNPAHERITIHPGAAFPRDCSVALFDSFGRAVRSASVTGGQQTTFDTQDLASGMYQAVLRSGAAVARLPVAVAR